MNISSGLRGLLKLPEVSAGQLSGPAREFSQSLRQALEGLNEAMQKVAAQASQADFQALDQQRAQLIEKCQLAQSKLDKSATSKASEAQERVVQAVGNLQKKAVDLLSGAGDGRQKWLDREADFDDAMLRTGELQEAGHPKAASFLKLGEAIRDRANSKKFGDALAALAQWEPKLQQVIKEQEQAGDDNCQNEQPREGLSLLVKDADSGEVIEGASATVGDQTDTTSALGLATVELPVGKHRYEVTAKGYSPAKGAVEIIQGDNPELVIELTRCAAREGLTVLVRDKASGEVIEGATATVGDQTDTTSSNGLATVELPVGTHRYEVSAEGYTSVKDSVEVIEGDNPELIVELAKCDVSREGLTVLVRDKSSGEVIEGATATVGDQTDTTSSNGLATVELPVGSHRYEVSAKGYASVKDSVEVIEGDNPELIVELTKCDVTEGVLTALVKDKHSGAAIEGAEVTIGEQTETTSANGLATFELPTGSHAYRATADKYQKETGTVEVVEGDNAELVIEMSKDGECQEASLVVIVVDDNTGEVIEGATVTVGEKTETTSASGLVLLTLEPGRHDYEASAADYPDPETGTVEVKEGDDNELTIRLKREVTQTTVTFHVTGGDWREPVEGASVNFGGGSGTTDAEGKAAFEVANEDYSYVVSKDGFTDATGSVEVVEGGNTDEHVHLKLEPDFCPPPESKQPTLRKGDESADGWVEYLQNLLNKYLGPGTVEQNGVFDQKTYDAVKAFQSAPENQPPELSPGMLIDGIVGNETWSILRKGPREAVGVNNQPDEQGVEARWATEVANFVRYDSSVDEIQMTAFSVGDAPIDDAVVTVKLVGKQTGEDKISQSPLGPPTGPSPTGAGHLHVYRIPRVTGSLPGNTEQYRG